MTRLCVTEISLMPFVVSGHWPPPSHPAPPHKESNWIKAEKREDIGLRGKGGHFIHLSSVMEYFPNVPKLLVDVAHIQ